MKTFIALIAVFAIFLQTSPSLAQPASSVIVPTQQTDGMREFNITADQKIMEAWLKTPGLVIVRKGQRYDTVSTKTFVTYHYRIEAGKKPQTPAGNSERGAAWKAIQDSMSR